MIIGFTGSRFLRPHQCSEIVKPVLEDLDPFYDLVVVGDAMGVDLFVREWCQEHRVAFSVFFAHWDKYGNAAGPIRNRRMAAMVEKLYAFPGPESRGTLDMIGQCEKEILCQEITIKEVSR